MRLCVPCNRYHSPDIHRRLRLLHRLRPREEENHRLINETRMHTASASSTIRCRRSSFKIKIFFPFGAFFVLFIDDKLKWVLRNHSVCLHSSICTSSVIRSNSIAVTINISTGTGMWHRTFVSCAHVKSNMMETCTRVISSNRFNTKSVFFCVLFVYKM